MLYAWSNVYIVSMVIKIISHCLHLSRDRTENFGFELHRF